MKECAMNCLYNEETILSRVKELAAQIETDYKDDEPILCVCVLRGAVLFFADLVKELCHKNVLLDFITISSYDGATASNGKIDLIQEMRESVAFRHVLIVEDIVDSGKTVAFLREYFLSKNPLDVKVACLLDKPMARKVSAHADYVAFTLLREAFVVGYGLDYAQRYRNLNAIYELTEE